MYTFTGRGESFAICLWGKGNQLKNDFICPKLICSICLKGPLHFGKPCEIWWYPRQWKVDPWGERSYFFTLFINNWLIFLRGGIVQKFKISDIFTFNCEKWNFLSLAVFYDLIKYRDLSNIPLNFFQDTAVA